MLTSVKMNKMRFTKCQEISFCINKLDKTMGIMRQMSEIMNETTKLIVIFNNFNIFYVVFILPKYSSLPLFGIDFLIAIS